MFYLAIIHSLVSLSVIKCSQQMRGQKSTLEKREPEMRQSMSYNGFINNGVKQIIKKKKKKRKLDIHLISWLSLQKDTILYAIINIYICT